MCPPETINARIGKLEAGKQTIPVAAIAASFQDAVVDVLVNKTIRAAKEFKAKTVLIAGGVSANAALRETIQEQARVAVSIPPIALCTDNAAMIAAAGYYRFAHGQRDSLDIDAVPNWPLSEI